VKFYERRTVEGSEISHLAHPTVLVAIVSIYHVPGVKGNLRFSGPVLADIFLGNIKTWDNQQLKTSTRPAPASSGYRRRPSHRWKVPIIYSATFFRRPVQVAQPNWQDSSPPGLWVLAQSRRGYDGESEGTSGAIGYIEFGFTLTDNSVGVGHVQNASGKYIGATQSSIAAAYHSAEKFIPADFAHRSRTVRATMPIRSSASPGSMCRKNRRIRSALGPWPISSSGTQHGEQSAEQHGYTRCQPRSP